MNILHVMLYIIYFVIHLYRIVLFSLIYIQLLYLIIPLFCCYRYMYDMFLLHMKLNNNNKNAYTMIRICHGILTQHE